MIFGTRTQRVVRISIDLNPRDKPEGDNKKIARG